MKKGVACLFISLIIFLCACSTRDDISSSVESLDDDVSSSHSSAPEPEESGMTDNEIITLAKELTVKGNEVFWWYMDEGMYLDVDTSDGDYTKIIRPVGKFGTIAELKSATEEVYSKQFCENILYPVGFNESQGDNIKFREIDGVLHINLNNGGMGWPYEMTEQISVKSKEPDKLVVTIISKDFDDIEVPFDFSLVSENGVWKLDNWYEFGAPSQDEPHSAESGTSVSESAVAVSMININKSIDAFEMNENDTEYGWTLTEIELYDTPPEAAFYGFLTFTGEVALTGTITHVNAIYDGFEFIPDEESKEKMLIPDGNPEKDFRISIFIDDNPSIAESISDLAVNESGEYTIVLTQYSLAYVPMMATNNAIVSTIEKK